MKGFGIVVRHPRPGHDGINATFVLQIEVKGRVRKFTIGRFGAWTVDKARDRARELVVAVDKGEDPDGDRAATLTLGEAIKMHVENMRRLKRSVRSITCFETESKKFFKDWLERPLASITREDCRNRHDTLTKKHGLFSGNRSMRHLRAAYMDAAKAYETLPPRAPTIAVTWNPEHASTKCLQWSEIAAWWRDVASVGSPVRRDIQYLILLTGLRSTDAKTIRCEHVDLDRGTVHRPNPKGGTKRAFTIPLAAWVVEMLRRRQEENRILYGKDVPWVFPSKDMKGKVTHLQEVRVSVRDEGSKKKRTMINPHALRHTWISAAHACRVPGLESRLLVNHYLPRSGDVHENYTHLGIESLRQSTEAVAAFLLRHAGVEQGEKRNAG